MGLVIINIFARFNVLRTVNLYSIFVLTEDY